MRQDPIQRLEIESKFDLSGVKIENRVEGENNFNTVFSANSGRYVLRTPLHHREESQLFWERKILNFLEQKSISFVPRSIDLVDDFHLISFVGDESVSVENLENRELESWIQKLAEIHSIEFSEFREFCEVSDLQSEEPKSVTDQLKDLGARAEDLVGEGRYSELARFAGEAVEQLGSQIPEPSSERSLIHSDIPGNTRKTGEDLFVIDWEFASFSRHPASDLGILFAHRDFTEEKRTWILEMYRQAVEPDDYLEETVEWSEKLRNIFNIIWCLENLRPEKKNYLDFARRQRENYLSLE